jgi:putative transposase
MLNAIFRVLRFIVLILAGHKEIALENAALRQQLTIFKREQPRPKLRHRDRLFWIALMKIWKKWRTALVVVQPATVVSWQRRRFKQYWRKLSQKKRPGRPKVSAELRKLVRTMVAANVTWGAPRIHGELLKLGCEVSERTVSRLMPKPRKHPSQTWKTFLTNHVGQLVSIDFFTVSTLQLKVLFVFVVVAHERRRVLISMSRSIPPQNGQHSRSLKPFRRTRHRVI